MELYEEMNVIDREKNSSKTDGSVIGPGMASDDSQDGAIRAFMDRFIQTESGIPSIDELMDLIGRYFDADRSYIFEQDSTGQYSVNTYEWCAQGVTAEIQNLQEVPLFVLEPWYKEFRAKGSFYLSCDDQYARQEPLVYEVLEPQGISSLIAAPFMLGSQIIGFLGVANPKKHIDHQLYLSVAASMLNHEILLMRESRKEEERKLQLQSALELARESSTMLNEVHEVLGAAPWKIEFDPSGENFQVKWSDGVRRLYGYENKEEFPDSMEFPASRVYEQDRTRLMKEVNGAIAGFDRNEITISSKYRAYRKDGSLRWFLMQGLIRRKDDGTARVAYGVIRDVTDIENARTAEAEALESLEACHEALGSAKWQMNFDEKGNMTSCIWSDRFRKMLGYHGTEDFPNELSSWSDLLHPSDKKMTLKAYWDAVNDHTGRTLYSVEYRLLTRTRGYRWYAAHGCLSRYPDGRPKVYYGMFLDINDQVLTAQSQAMNLKEISELNNQMEEKQEQLEAASAEQEAQIEEIKALNDQLQQNQTRMEEVSTELEVQLEETQVLNARLEETRDEISEAYGIVEGLSAEYHTIWLVDKTTLRMKLIRSNGMSTAQDAVKMAQKVVKLDPTVEAYVARYVEPEDRERALRQMSSAEVLRHLNEDKYGIYAVNYLRRDEKDRVGYHQIAFANADTRDGKKQFVLAFRDIDKIVKEEQAQKEELKKAKEAADAANKAKTSFLFNMSHDIRTPMNAVLGFTELLKKHKDDPEKLADYINKIESSSQFLLSLINSVLEIARIESGKTELDEAPVHVGTITEEMKSMFDPQMQKKNITFTTEVDAHTDCVFCDAAKYHEIYLNILSNAYKYTPAGGKVSVLVKELPCELPEYALIQLTISDSGIGMSEEYLPRLFEEFSRERTSTESRQEGTGLGMPIVKKLVDLMDGSIDVKSELGKGSTFTITIPFKVANFCPIKAADPENSDLFDFTGKHVLLAEDNDLNAEIAMEILGEAGLEIDRAEDGVACIDMLAKAEAGYYDLVLMDIQMPNLDGYGAVKYIRAMDDKAKAAIPIIAMTANAFEEDKRNALAAGMNGHIAKPIDVLELMKTLAGIL